MCNEEEVNFYQNLIGILRWIVELGRIDIHYEVALLSQHLASPKVGHMEQAFQIFKYLYIHRYKLINFDSTRLEIGEPLNNMENSDLKRKETLEFYRDPMDDKPQNEPESRGELVQLNFFVDSDHAGNVMTRRSHTGIIIFKYGTYLLVLKKGKYNGIILVSLLLEKLQQN